MDSPGNSLTGQPPSVTDRARKAQDQPVTSSISPVLGERASQLAGRPAGAKEAELVPPSGPVEGAPPTEVRELGELPPEIAGWLERVERDDVAEPPTVVHQGKTVVSPAAPTQAQVTLPLTSDDLKKGLHRKILESIRWLAEWCLRLVKKYHGKVAYKLGEKGS